MHDVLSITETKVDNSSENLKEILKNSGSKFKSSKKQRKA